MTLLERYTERINQQIKTVEETQNAMIITVGNVIAEAVKNGRGLYIYDTGHIVDQELRVRGGGLVLLKRFGYDLVMPTNDCLHERDRSDVNTSMEGFAAYAIRKSPMLPGDVLVIGSVSGKSESVVDLAIEAKKFGLITVALTSVEYSSQVASEHSSGLRLFEATDYVLDNCAPAAEGMLEIPGIEAPFGAASGISAALIMWSVCAQVVDKLMEYGITPSIYKSGNFGGEPYNTELRNNFKKNGY